MAVGGPCADAIRDAAGHALSDDDVLHIAETIQRKRAALLADGKVDRLDERLREAARTEGDRARLAAALARKHAALNIIVRDRLETAVAAHVAAGLSYKRAVLAVLEGTTRGVAGGRVSVAATRLAFESRFVGEMLAEIARERPHLEKLLDDERMMGDAVREMFELRPDGRPGITGNADAQFLAQTFAKYAEVSRTDLNRLGATIGRLHGWAGPQAHDPHALLRVSPEEWTARILPRLDMTRTFADVADPAEHLRILGEVYTTITTGRDSTITAKQRGEVTGPANLARSLEQHRVLHFKSADDWLAYNAEFGHGNLFSSMVAHQSRSARLAAQMQVLGPNPEVMLGSLIESLKRRIRNDTSLPQAERRAALNAMEVDAVGSSIGAALAEVRGLTLAPVNETAARWSSAARAVQDMAKLGGAVISSIGADLVGAAANLRFNGQPLFAGYSGMMREFLRGRGEGEAREIAFALGEGFDGLIDHINSAYVAGDAAPGQVSRAMSTFFRWSGLTWETDAMRAAGARMLSAWLGLHVDKGWAAVPEQLRHVLGLHGIGEPQWQAIRAADFMARDGKVYVTPDRIAALPDEAVLPLVAERLAGMKTPSADAQARVLNEARLDLELALRRYFADEVSFGHVETDEASRRMTLLNSGARPGTVIGEALRFVMQFKGFPIAFTNRVMGRAIYGGRGATRGERMLHQAGHIGHLIAGLTIAGYMAMTAKDFLRGYEPRQPEEADDWVRVISAAMVQGGGAGIYGDFLFGSANRFGGGAIGTLAGPTLGTAGQLIDIWSRTKEGDLKAADVFNVALQNTPFVNLWYTRPALEYLVLGALHESLSPGYQRRQERRRLEDFGQERLWRPLQW